MVNLKRHHQCMKLPEGKAAYTYADKWDVLQLYRTQMHA